MKKVSEILFFFMFFLIGFILAQLYTEINTIYEEPITKTVLERPSNLINFAELDMIATYYAPLDNQSGICANQDPTNTATGTYPTSGTIAVNPNIIPYSSILIIEYEDGSREVGIACDTGSAINKVDNRIDIYRDTYDEAINDGIKNVKVYFFTP